MMSFPLLFLMLILWDNVKYRQWWVEDAKLSHTMPAVGYWRSLQKGAFFCAHVY